jgi:fatty-acyl-CoA synthase
MKGQALLELRALRAMAKAGVLAPMAPRRQLAALRAQREFGAIGGGLVGAALRYGERAAVLDDRGRTSFCELESGSNAAARGLRARGLGDGAVVGILARNHAGALMGLFATAKAGSRTVFLNTGSAPPQLREVCEREGVRAILVDQDLREPAAEVAGKVELIGCWAEDEAPLAELRGGQPTRAPEAPARHGSIVFLTSGTTGTPRGAPRAQPRSLVAPGGVLERIPLRSGESTVGALPLFHGTGFLLATLGVALGSTQVMRRRFDPEQCLADLEAEQASALLVVPTMLERLLALGEGRIAAAGLARLRVVFCTGSELSVALAARARDALGEVVYDLYGSTEVSVATIATPEELRQAPGTVGRAVLGARVRILDGEGAEVGAGVGGRVFVGSSFPFEGYSGGGSKEEVDGLLGTGDLGHVDERGLLFIDGREDEMIVSGGENVYPAEVEELLAAHPGIEEVAAIGAPDPEFGERLVVFVVRGPDVELEAEQVREHVKTNLARYKVPRDVVFVAGLPRNAMGKVMKRELVEGLGEAE